MTTRNFPKLSTTLISSAIVAFVVAVAVVSLPIRSHVGAFERTVQSERVMRAGRALQLALSKTVEREWNSLRAVASQIDMRDPASRRRFAEAVPQASPGVAWVGIASPDGRVLTGSSGFREGEDVREFRWFREGLRFGSVGAVYVPSGGSGMPGAEQGLINMSAPIVDDFGVARGVVAYSLRVDWLSGYMVQAARELGLDISVLDRTGREIISLNELIDAPIDPEITALAEMGHDLTRYVSGGVGGEAHVTGVFPNMLVGEMPHFGWDLVVRVPALQGQTSLTDFMRQVSWTIAALFMALAVGTVLYAIYFLRPIEELSRAAADIAEGGADYPPESLSSRESAALSAALARIQSRVLNGGSPGPAA
ncbi:cache domain-containing protein [Histidinibacterium aquaticum]|uniref:Uncharacterized protein n=1 Tax=Histidinibacterium aquaticum TaxID=2613962 RepID=A0A5J5GIN1_9RHOB|nr:cache domain-containing protein [Histidinibacterium aquaticum]KAA9008091.1 hypothetical protein F3S47_11325 [Histidinibacterium aquaticum]